MCDFWHLHTTIQSLSSAEGQPLLVTQAIAAMRVRFWRNVGVNGVRHVVVESWRMLC